MSVKVEIEKHSGFCGGVIRAVAKAEELLEAGQELYSLGGIVHNEAELSRLRDKGLRTLSPEELHEYAGKTALIRAHGEPPETYSRARALGIRLVDCTCPVVLNLQKSIREAYSRIHPLGGQIVLFGKIGHPEVLGLLGQVGGDAVVVEDTAMLEKALASGRIRPDRPLEVFSQTTKSPDAYAALCSLLQSQAGGRVHIHRTICSQVASRHRELADFAKKHEVIVFVAGVSSSNGKVLFDLCRNVNPRTHLLSSPADLSPDWFRDSTSAGVCGATSTPRWLLEEVADAIRRSGDQSDLQNEEVADAIRRSGDQSALRNSAGVSPNFSKNSL